MSNLKMKEAGSDYSGIFGNRLYLKARGSSSEITIPKKRAKLPPTEGQVQVRTRFTKAAMYAKHVLTDPVMATLYRKKAGKSASAYVLALTDYLKPPVVDLIDASGYSGHTGDKILVEAHDIVAVTGVKVRLTAPDGTVTEQGDCVLNPRIGYWEYTATTEAGALAGVQVTATASDHAAHTGEKTITL